MEKNKILPKLFSAKVSQTQNLGKDPTKGRIHLLMVPNELSHCPSGDLDVSYYKSYYEYVCIYGPKDGVHVYTYINIYTHIYAVCVYTYIYAQKKKKSQTFLD